MRQKRGWNSRIQNGRTALLLIGVVTLVDMILAACSVRLTFPSKLDFPLWLVSKGTQGEFPLWTGYVSCVLFACLYLSFFFLTMNRRTVGKMAVPRQVFFRIGWILYLADMLFYSVRSAAQVNSSGFTITNIIEILFHLVLTVLLYLADRAASRPEEDGDENERNDVRKNDGQKKPPEPNPEDDGIQW